MTTRYSLFAMVAFAVAAACSDEATQLEPQLELVNPDDRLSAERVNAHLYGSFRVGTAGGHAIVSGPANFPGHPPAGPGTCENGKWINAQGTPIAGSATNPHPHCIAAEGSIEIVLEPISACYSEFAQYVSDCLQPAAGEPQEALNVGPGSNSYYVIINAFGFPPSTSCSGNCVVVGYAIDAATLGTTNRRVGTLTIDLAQYNSYDTDYFTNIDGSGNCIVASSTVAYPCLNKVITATYNPLPAPDGVGPTDHAVEGFLWIQPADSPFNYTDN